jgi:hypothetical protein
MKTISIFFALVNSLFAGFLILYNLSSATIQQTELWWLLIKLLAGGSVIVIGILTWIGSLRYVKPELAALASMYLAALGAGAAVWSVHLAQVTGDMKYYMLIYAGSLFIQGIAMLFGLTEGHRNTSIA